MRVITAILIAFILTACGDDKASTSDLADDNASSSGLADDKASSDDFADSKVAADYKKKVDKKVGSVVLKSVVKELGVSEEQAKCLLGNLKLTQLGLKGSDPAARADPAVQAVFDECGVNSPVSDS
jgi:hypothetical protein